MAALALDADRHLIGRGEHRALAQREGAERQVWHVVHAIDFLDAERLHQPVVDHRLGAAAAFFGRLENDDRRTGEIARRGEIARGAQQHRGVAVVAAGVHLARNGRAIGQVGHLFDRQRVHVGAKANDARACALSALDHADDAGSPKPRAHFVAAEFGKARGDEGGGLIDVVEQLGMGVEMAAPLLGVGRKGGEGGADGHDALRSGRRKQNAATAGLSMLGAAAH